MKHRDRINLAAEWYIERYCVSVIPLGLAINDSMSEEERVNRQKRPRGSWIEYQSRQASVKEATAWNCDNLGIVTGSISGLVVVDCESREDAEWFYRERGKSNTIVQTRRGYHLYFYSDGQNVPNATKLEGRYDIRGEGGYVVAPPSVVGGHRYTFVARCPMRLPSEMPRFDMRWRYPHVSGAQPRERRKIADGIKYIRTMRAIAGQSGHNTTWRAVQRLKDSGLDATDALAVLVEWNQTNCDPPWTIAELLHKVKGVYSSAS